MAGRRGPKPLPTVLKLARGNPGKRRLNQNEPQPDPELGVGDPPTDMPDAARGEWTRLGSELEAMGVLTHVDRHTFIAYCRNWARLIEANEMCHELGDVVKSPSGYPIQNPYRAVANKAYQQCKPGFPIWSWYPPPENRRRALIFLGSDARNPAAEGDTQWVNYKPSHFSSRSMGI